MSWVLFVLCTLSGDKPAGGLPHAVWVRPSAVVVVSEAPHTSECSEVITSTNRVVYVKGTVEEVKEKLDAK